MNLLIIITIMVVLVMLVTWIQSDQKTSSQHNRKTQDIDKLDQLLPQTQCGDCGYNGCRPYAEAIVNNMEDINRCLPGGMQTVQLLSAHTGRCVKPLYRDSQKQETIRLAVIDEAVCIGCVKCIKACPVEAILGAPKVMHSVINKYCTGCELCVAPCPVDCISMVEVTT